MIVLHTTDCSKCKILEKKLDAANIGYIKNYDPQVMLEAGMLSAPGLQIDDAPILDFMDAVAWVNQQKG